MRAAHGGVIPTAGTCPHKPLPNADCDGGVFWVWLFWAQTEVVRRRKHLGLRFIFSVGCVFTILGSSLTEVLVMQVITGTQNGFPWWHPKWHADWNGHNFAEGYLYTDFGSS